MLLVRVSHSRQFKGDDSDKKGYSGLPGWGWASGYQPHPVKKFCYETSRGGQGPPRAVQPMMMMMMTVC